VSERDALETIEKMHQPVDGMGFTSSGYGSVDSACQTCGTADEYAVIWPCLTVRTAWLGLGKPLDSPALQSQEAGE
jgi:hypothetical protein